MAAPSSGKTTVPLRNKAQMIDYLAKGEKPIENWRIGTEHEKIGFCNAKLLPLPYEGPLLFLH